MFEVTEQYIDEAQGVHVVNFDNNDAKPPARHQLQILVGHNACPVCGHVVPRDLDTIDPKKHIGDEHAALNQQFQAVRAYGKKHNVPGRKK